MKSLLSAGGVFLIILLALFWMHSKEKLPPKTGDTFAIDASPQTGAKAHPPNPVITQVRSKKEYDSAPPKIPVHPSRQRDDGIDLGKLNPDYPTLDMRLQAMSSRRNGQRFDPDEVMETLKEPAAWEADNAPGEKLSLTDEEKKDGREFIRFNRLKLETLVKGDTLEIPIAQSGEVYKARIIRARPSSDGSVTWYGRLIDDTGPVIGENGNVYDVSFTSGQRVVSGGIFTPKGHFVIQAVEDQGWVATSQTLFKQNENEPCALVPGQGLPGNEPHQ